MTDAADEELNLLLSIVEMSMSKRVVRYTPLLEVTLSNGSQQGLQVQSSQVVPRHTFRMQREYGSERFALVKVNPVLSTSLTSRGASSAAHSRLMAAALEGGFHHGGRKWTWLHGKFRSPQAIFFAEEGVGLRRIDVGSVRAWHIPPLPTLKHATQNTFKYSARMDLGFSKAVPLGEVSSTGGEGGGAGKPFRSTPHPDILSPTSGLVMTDGCAGAGAGILAAAGRALSQREEGGEGALSISPSPSPSTTSSITATHASISGNSGGGGIGSPPLSSRPPAVFQGRVGGHKGVWYLDTRLPPNAIHLRPSQCKLEYPPETATPTQCTIEAMRCSRERGPSSLNLQITALLAGWGVPCTALRALQRRAVEGLVGMTATPEGAATGLALVGEMEGGREAVEATSLLGGRLWGEHRLGTLLRKVQERGLTKITSKGRIPVERSRCVFMIADPTGWLKPGEAYFRPSSSPKPITGPLLLARNPAHHPDDLVAAQGVTLAKAAAAAAAAAAASTSPTTFSPTAANAAALWEDSLVDVLVLSVQGDAPMASQLAGGDYDGDMTWVCWEGSLVEPVHLGKRWRKEKEKEKAEVQVKASPEGAADGAGVGTGTSLPSTLAAPPSSSTPPPPSVVKAPATPIIPSSAVLGEQYIASLTDSALGHASNLHLAWADRFLSDWQERGGGQGGTDPLLHPLLPPALWEKPCLELAHLCSTLVDTTKTGEAPLLPDRLKNTHYPHFLGRQGVGGNVRRSKSALGLMYDDMVALVSGETLPALKLEVRGGQAKDDSAAVAASTVPTPSFTIPTGLSLPVGLDAPPTARAVSPEGGANSTTTTVVLSPPLTLPPSLVSRLAGKYPAQPFQPQNRSQAGSKSGGGGGGGGGGGVSVPLPRPTPHPKILARSEALNWRAFEALAERHLNEFIADCVNKGVERGRAGVVTGSSGGGSSSSSGGSSRSSSRGGSVASDYGSDSDGSGSSSGGGGGGVGGEGESSCDEGDAMWDAAEGGYEEVGGEGDGEEGSPHPYKRAVERARRRLLFVELRTGGEVVRGVWERRVLALAYYRVTWLRFNAPNSSRLEPHAFPWVIAGDYILSAIK